MEKVVICTVNRVYIVSGIFLCVFGIIFSVFLRQSLTRQHVSKRIVLTEDGTGRKIWSDKLPYEFHAYIFNVTNPDAIMVGEKAIVQEIGPFVYDVWQQRIDIEDHEEDDTVSYTLKKTFFFNAAKSNGLSDEDEFTLIHFMYVGMPNAILISQPTKLPLLSKSIDSLFDNPTSLFVKVKAKKYLFDGYEINCMGMEEFFGKVVCNNIKENWFKYRYQIAKDDYYTRSAWGTFNDTVAWAGRTRINRGTKNIQEIGKIVKFNNSSDFATWDDEGCDKILGTDGTMFHPFISQQEHLYQVDTVVKRNFDYQYDSKVVYNDLQLYRYAATVGTDLETNPADKCYCIAPDRCLKNGVFELWKCMNWALIASNPHFYLADPYYNDAIVGLNPDKEKHMSTFDVEPLTGIVVRASFRMQHYAQLTKQPKYRLLKNVYEVALPIGWTEEKFVLPDPLVDNIKQLHSLIEIEKILGYSMILIGLGFFGFGIVLDSMQRKKSNLFK